LILKSSWFWSILILLSVFSVYLI